MKKRNTLYFLIIVVAIFAISIVYFPWGDSNPNVKEAIQEDSSRIQAEKTPDVPGLPKQRVPTSETKSSLDHGDAYLKSHQTELNIRPYHKPAGRVIKTPMGDKVYYTFSQGGLPIVGLWLSVQFDRDYGVIDFQNHYRPVNEAEIHNPRDPSAVVEKFRSPIPVVLQQFPNQMNSVLYLQNGNDTPMQSYVYPAVNKRNPRQTMHVIVRQTDGQLLGLTTSRF